jgi:hypothetical protein
LKYIAALIAYVITKTAAIIAILDSFVDDETYVDYGEGYWSHKTLLEKKKAKQKKPKKIIK